MKDQLISKRLIAIYKSGGRPVGMYRRPSRPITPTEGWKGDIYNYTGRDKKQYEARINNTTGSWEYRPKGVTIAKWKVIPKGYTTTGGFKFDDNLRLSTYFPSANTEFVDKKLEEVKKQSQDAEKRAIQMKKAQAKDKSKVPFINNTAELQNALWHIGAFEGLTDKRGREVDYNKAVDGLRARNGNGITEAAIKKAIDMGYTVDENTGQVTKKVVEEPKVSFKTTGGTGYIPSNQFDYTYTQDDFTEDTSADGTFGHAIYLHYPNFKGASRNAIKIGGFDPGEAIGNPSVPVGHAATILIDKDGNANYYEYGRYSPENGHLIGTAQRPSVKGGNWRHFKLDPQKAEESDSAYVARIQDSLPDTKTGAYQAMTIPDVDTDAATKWIYSQANDPNREEYGIDNTCATGACKATLNFRRKKHFDPFKIFNREGYDTASKIWSLIPGSTDSYAQRARASSTGVYTMNK